MIRRLILLLVCSAICIACKPEARDDGTRHAEGSTVEDTPTSEKLTGDTSPHGSQAAQAIPPSPTTMTGKAAAKPTAQLSFSVDGEPVAGMEIVYFNRDGELQKSETDVNGKANLHDDVTEALGLTSFPLAACIPAAVPGEVEVALDELVAIKFRFKGDSESDSLKEYSFGISLIARASPARTKNADPELAKHCTSSSVLENINDTTLTIYVYEGDLLELYMEGDHPTKPTLFPLRLYDLTRGNRIRTAFVVQGPTTVQITLGPDPPIDSQVGIYKGPVDFERLSQPFDPEGEKLE